jgi:transposase
MARKKKSKGKRRSRTSMLMSIQPNVAGIDIGSKEHWVCGPPGEDGRPNVRVFRTTTKQLEEMTEWLLELGVESVAMESTYIYWIPVYELLEEAGLEVVLVNARQMHNVPGRKTDMRDCQWIQCLHSCGLLRGSFRPTEVICRVRAMQRQVGNLVQERTKSVQWMQKSLDQMNVQIHRAVSDLTGHTGMSIVRAIVAGERSPAQLATFRSPGCRKSQEQIAEYLVGNWREEHLFNLESALNLYDHLQEQIARYEARIQDELTSLQPPDRREQPAPAHPNPTKDKAIRHRGEQELRTTLWRFAGVDLTRIDGISSPAALTVLTEVGLDLCAFPTEKHFVSWLRLSPRTPISGGKPVVKKKNGTAATRIASTLRMAALSQQRAKTALGAYFRRVARRKGGAVAVFATARKLAVYIYRMLVHGQDYVDIGADAYEAQFVAKRLAGLKNTAKTLGYELVPAVATG